MRRMLLSLMALAALAAGAYVYLYGAPASPAWLAGLTGQRAPAATPAAPPMPPPEVGVVEVRAGEVPVALEYAGRVIGFRDVEVRPRVGGLLLRRAFEEGTRVKEGQDLFLIDPATYQVAQTRAEAQVSQAQATVRQTEENFRRADELVRRGAGTERQRDDAEAARDQARATLSVAEAELQNARLNLSYTTVKAPVSGITALQSPTIGSLIQPQATLLTTITQLDPAYVSFSFTDEEGQAFRELNQRRAKPISEKDLSVELHYGSGTVYPQMGRIDSAAQRVDPQTGTIQARAVFPNPDGALLPGQFVRIMVRGFSLPDAIVIPEQAVSQGPQGPSVFVVGENGTAQARPVRLGRQVPAGWVAQEGLKPGERVVVEGVIRVRPGAPVRPVPVASPPQQAGRPGEPPAAQRADATERGPAPSGAARPDAPGREARP
ncbi:efflux RND transporter periplasmic adaptor subunit [Salinarimonas soli]|nr:efflux RND transporter periplasmic adaptor subunit [Salinarimonas soli]